MRAWSKDRADALAYLWGIKKLSLKQCAIRLHCTRNAIAGKVHRLKLNRRKKQYLTEEQKRERAREVKRLWRAKWKPEMMKLRKRKASKPNLDFVPRKLKNLTAPSTEGVTILARKHDECAYPLDNGLFCGAPVIWKRGGWGEMVPTSWCEYHWVLCHRKDAA